MPKNVFRGTQQNSDFYADYPYLLYLLIPAVKHKLAMDTAHI